MKKGTTVILFVLSLLCSLEAFAQGTWETYTTDDGIADNTIMTLTVGIDGVVWCGYGRTICRYDGKEWTTFRPYDDYTTSKSSVTNETEAILKNHVEALAVDYNGVLWVGNHYNAMSYDGKTWRTFTTENGLAYNHVSSVAVGPDGVVWFGTSGGVSRYDGESWITYTISDGLVDNDIHAIAVSPNGKVWAGTWGSGASFFDGYTWNTFAVDNGYPVKFIYEIAIGRDGVVWIGTAEGLSKYEAGTWKTFNKFDGLSNEYAGSLAVCPKGDVWVGTKLGVYPKMNNGVSCFNGEIWKTYTTNDGLADNHVTSIAIGHDGSIWFGTWGGGVSRFLEEIPAVINTFAIIPFSIKILGNYPNPFNPETTIQFALSHETSINLDICNIMGQKVRTLVSQRIAAGTHCVLWNGRDDRGQSASSGMYFVGIMSQSGLVTHRMMLLR